MNNEHDPLEAELAALRPVEPSDKLADRIARRLENEAAPAALSKINGTRNLPATYFSRRWLGLTLAGGMVAASLIVAVVLWRSDHTKIEADLPLDPPQPSLATVFDDQLPSVWTYRSSLQSPSALDQLLDQHARLAPAPSPTPVQTRGFGSLSVDLNSRLGGL